MEFPELEKLIRETVRRLGQPRREGQQGGAAPVISQIIPLTSDASLRRYFRIKFVDPLPSGNGELARSAVAMYFDSTTAAEVGGGMAMSSDEAYVQLTAFFSLHGLRVPQLLLDARDVRLLIIEDCGDNLLGGFLGKTDSTTLHSYYSKAIKQLQQLQAIPPQSDRLPFNRSFSGQLFLKEMLETADYFLPAFDHSTALKEEVSSYLAELAALVDRLPKILVHRDYHSWNLLLYEQEIRVIDFQDALMGPRVYDLISLLHDRDTDRLLGDTLVRQLAEEFRLLMTIGSDFEYEYRLCSLQRDLKVVGRFAKLVTLRKLANYARWIPGTYFRVLGNLDALGGLTEQAGWQRLRQRLSKTVGEDPGRPFSS